jgi:hypothetical protein
LQVRNNKQLAYFGVTTGKLVVEPLTHNRLLEGWFRSSKSLRSRRSRESRSSRRSSKKQKEQEEQER